MYEGEGEEGAEWLGGGKREIGSADNILHGNKFADKRNHGKKFKGGHMRNEQICNGGKACLESQSMEAKDW